ncbi:MAG: 5'-methylthioadenosine/S-adenosylhomocysteine nucleosidase [Micrococcales bacterium]|nr:5'-methylthioadenosine/S-adenosylhomocysteine nucleosidase [Micrococcales bacterium]
MAEEAEPFLAQAEATDAAELKRADANLAVIAGRVVMLVRSGIGLVNAATATSYVLTTLLDDIPVGMIVSAGTAGGLGTDVRVGDVVVSSETLYSSADATGFGYALGQVPGMPERYTCDRRLVAAAAAAGTPDIPTRTGLVVSSDSFVTAQNVDEVRNQFPEALSTDMESAALSQVAHLFGVPFVSVRGVSDLCGPAASDDHATHVDDASERSAHIVVEMLTQTDV